MKTTEIKLSIDGVTRYVSRTLYVEAKTKQLREFGYTTLTKKHVAEQLEKILTGDKDLSVIGRFMEDEVIVP